MLNKEVCRKCYNVYYRKVITSIVLPAYFESGWKLDVIACPFGTTRIGNPPPKECPYWLEQLVTSQKRF
jgi:hypothetical protein